MAASQGLAASLQGDVQFEYLNMANGEMKLSNVTRRKIATYYASLHPRDRIVRP
jgi:hypothetical protein